MVLTLSRLVLFYRRGGDRVENRFEGYRVYRIVYELLMVSLVVVSIGLFWVGDSEIGKFLTRVVWGIFFLDVVVRLILARSRWMYIAKNPFDVISIIPLDEFMLFARFARIIDLFRMKTILGRYIRPITRVLSRIHLKELAMWVVCMVGVVLIILIGMGNGVINSLKFIGMHFFKFNSELMMDSGWLMSLAIVVKVMGMVVFATLLSRGLVVLEKKWEDRKKARLGGRIDS